MHPWSIARRLFVGQLLFIVCATIIVSWAVVIHSRDTLVEQSGDRMRATAVSIADSPFVIEAMADDDADASARLAPYAQAVQSDAPLDFITIMRPDGTRLTHPDDTQIGQKYLGSIEPARTGETLIETYTGTLGESIRAIAPVRSADGTIVGMVAAGQKLDTIEATALRQLPGLITVAALFALASAAFSLLLHRYLTRVTHGQGPEQLARNATLSDAALHGIDDGIVLTDEAGRLLLYNDTAAQQLGMPPAHRLPTPGPSPETDLQLPESVRELVDSGRECDAEIHVIGSRVLSCSQGPATTAGRAGSRRRSSPSRVLVLRDLTELTAVTGQLRSTRTLTDALRSQTHEHANRLHVVLSLLELGRDDEAMRLISRELGPRLELDAQVALRVGDPQLGALLAAKAAQAREYDVELSVETDDGFHPPEQMAEDLVTVLGNLIDNALDAFPERPVDSAPRWVHVVLARVESELQMTVADSAGALAADDIEHIFSRGFSTKEAGPAGRGVGLALVRSTVNALGGTIDVEVEAGTVFTVALPLTDEDERTTNHDGDGAVL